MNRSDLDPNLLANNPRANLQSWLRYQDLAIAAFRQHPRVHTFAPVSLRPTTVASRFRDAVRGCLAFKYPISAPDISHALLEEWWGQVIVKFTTAHVHIGPAARVLAELRGDAVSDTPESGYRFAELSLEEVTAFCVLISSGRLQGPVLVNTPPDVALIPERPNVEMTLRPDGKLLIL